MATRILTGPDKPALLLAVEYPHRSRVHFDVEGGTLQVQISELSEHPDGFTCELIGEVQSHPHAGVPFRAIYNVGSRAGSIEIGHPAPVAAPITPLEQVE